MVIRDQPLTSGASKVPTTLTYNQFLISSQFFLQSTYSCQLETELQSLWLVAHSTTVSFMKKLPTGWAQKCQTG